MEQIYYSYDAFSRRVRQTTKQAGGVVADSGFVYDRWNVVAEYNLATSTALAATNIWGLDLSNTRQQAGGIGGLSHDARTGNPTPILMMARAMSASC